MTMTLSLPRGGFDWRALLGRHGWIVLCAVGMAAAWFVSALAPEASRVSPHIRSMEWQSAAPGVAPGVEAWRPYELTAGTDGAPIWVRVTFEVNAQEAGAAALSLPGVFSARAYLNGVEIGAKGAPAFAAADETPGPIDAALPLAPAARVGMNEVLLFVSAHHAGYRPEALFNAIEILPRGGEAQRSVAKYGVALSQLGVLLAMAAAFAALAWRRRDAALSAAGLGAVLLLVAMAVETARTWWSYPYPLQLVRLSTVWLALSGFGLALMHAAALRFGVRIDWRVSLGATAGALLALCLIPGIDTRAQLALLALLAATFIIVTRRAAAGEASAQAFAVMIAATTMLLVVRGPDMIDNWIYVFGAMMLAVHAWARRAEAPVARDAPQMLALEDGAVPLADVVLVKAAGNYAEVYTVRNGCLLVRKPLSELAPGAPLMRVHRSYIVNLSRARRLVAKTGSRYELELANNESVPVSRKLADAVRAALAERLIAH